jgi:hypothetical protein
MRPSLDGPDVEAVWCEWVMAYIMYPIALSSRFRRLLHFLMTG